MHTQAHAHTNTNMHTQAHAYAGINTHTQAQIRRRWHFLIFFMSNLYKNLCFKRINSECDKKCLNWHH